MTDATQIPPSGWNDLAATAAVSPAPGQIGNSKAHLRIPLRSPAPLVAGILLAICAVGTLAYAVDRFGLMLGSGFYFWRLVSWPIAVVNWAYARPGDIPPVLLPWVSGLVLLATAGLLLAAARWSRLLAPSAILAGICLVLHPVFWALSLNWTRAHVGITQYQRYPQVGVLLIAGLIIGVLLLVAVVAPLSRSVDRVVKIAVIALIALEFVWLIPTLQARLGGYFSVPMLVPFALFLAAMIVLAVSLSADPAKAYYVPKPRPVRVVPAPMMVAQPAPMAMPGTVPMAAPPAPTYALVTMPDGSQQTMPVAQPAPVIAPPARKSAVGLGLGFIIAGVVVFIICSIAQGAAGSSMFSSTMPASTSAGLQMLAELTWWPGWLVTVGLVVRGVLALIFGRK